jgi:hypothetical protein
LTWATGETKGGFAMQCDKNDYRGVIAGLEGVTGKKAVNSDAMTDNPDKAHRATRYIASVALARASHARREIERTSGHDWIT